jgi:hypothetical protein
MLQHRDSQTAPEQVLDRKRDQGAVGIEIGSQERRIGPRRRGRIEQTPKGLRGDVDDGLPAAGDRDRGPRGGEAFLVGGDGQVADLAAGSRA